MHTLALDHDLVAGVRTKKRAGNLPSELSKNWGRSNFEAVTMPNLVVRGAHALFETRRMSVLKEALIAWAIRA